MSTRFLCLIDNCLHFILREKGSEALVGEFIFNYTVNIGAEQGS